MPDNMDTTSAAESQSSPSQLKRAVRITLGVSSDDNIRTRTFMLKPSSHAIQVGRSSRSDQNYMPAEDNAWFESRVISRNHAVFRASPEEQKLYLCDDGSMHGSFVNNKKVSNGEMYPLQSGDRIVFGCDIVRGPEKFAPVTADIELEWFEDLSPTRFPNRAYVVPLESDFDDDEVEFLQENICNSKTPTKTENGIRESSQKFSVPESDASSAGSFEHDEPNSKDSEFPASAFKLHTDITEPKMPNILSDSASARPPALTGSSRPQDITKLNEEIVDGVVSIPTKMSMTQPTAIIVDPSSVKGPETQEPLKPESSGVADLPKIDSARHSPDIYLTETDSDEEITSQPSLESPRSPIESVSSPIQMEDGETRTKAVPSNRGCKLTLGDKEYTEFYEDEYSDEEASDIESVHTDESDSCGSDLFGDNVNDENASAASAYLRTFQPAVNRPSTYPGPSTTFKNVQAPAIEPFSYVRDPSPSDAAMAKPSFMRNPTAPRSFGTEWDYRCHVPMTSDYTFQRAGRSSQYNSFPSHLADGYYGQCQSPIGLRPYTEGPFSSFQCDVGNTSVRDEPDTISSQMPLPDQFDTATPAPESVRKPTTKVSIDSIVEKPGTLSPDGKPVPSLKRKYAEITQDDDTIATHDTQSSIADAFPDAQVQTEIPLETPIMPGTSEASQPQMQINNIHTESVSSEPPAKRVRLSLDELPHKPAKQSSRTKQFAKYAATALGGAFVGAVGVVGTLVALPEGFFG